MAGRKRKLSVDYFPHYVDSGKTIFTIERMFGDKGYTIIFKTLELLSGSDGHFFDFNSEEEWLYLCAKFNSDPEKVISILDMLSRLGFIDQELYNNKILWSDNLIENLEPVYEKRTSELPEKPISAPGIHAIHSKIEPEKPIPGAEIPQSKVKRSKVKRSNSFSPPSIKEISNFCLERKNSVDPEKFFNFYESKGWMVGKNKMKNWQAAVRTWEKSDNKQNHSSETGELTCGDCVHIKGKCDFVIPGQRACSEINKVK